MMSEFWLQSYIYLAFRIDKVTQRLYKCPFVTDYYGPQAWKEAVAAEPEVSLRELVHQAATLLDTCAYQGFPLTRTQYLEKHLVSMETICRKLCGEAFSLQEEMRRCWDVEVKWTPEADFEQALAIYETVLPGTGSLPERLYAHEKLYALPDSQKHRLSDFVERALAETRRRTQVFVPLPEDERVTLQWFTERDSEAYAGYYGNYHSYVAIEPTAAAFHLPRLLDHLICHEIYPGHHTEAVLKEQELYHKQDFVEESMVLYVSPHNVISEGIAMLAHEIIFQPGEAEQWMAREVYEQLGITVDPSLFQRLREAFEMLVGIWSNAALLLDEGRPEAEVKDYFIKYMLRGEEVASHSLRALQHPVIGRYNLIYLYGQRLMRPWLQGSEKQMQFLRLLKEQVLPSQLER